MEDLPKEFAEALQSYNAQVTKVFSQYLTTVATEQERQRGEENKLPLSGIGKNRQQMAILRCYFRGFLLLHLRKKSVRVGDALNWLFGDKNNTNYNYKRKFKKMKCAMNTWRSAASDPANRCGPKKKRISTNVEELIYDCQ